MIGGAGSAYNRLFSDYNKYYALLKETLNNHPVITGVDLDIEEEVNLDDIKKLMPHIRHDFPFFNINGTSSSFRRRCTWNGWFYL